MNLDCQLGWICCHLGNRCLGMAMRVFPEFTETPPLPGAEERLWECFQSLQWPTPPYTHTPTVLRTTIPGFQSLQRPPRHTSHDYAGNHSWGWGSKMNKEEKEEGNWSSVCVPRASGQHANLVPDFTAHAFTSWRTTFFLKLWAKISHDSLRSLFTDFFVMVIKNISTMTFIYSVAFQVWIYAFKHQK